MSSKHLETATMRRSLIGLAAGALALSLSTAASAQEIFVTGPLAGAPAARKLRLYREGRFQFAPSASFTLLDEYQRTLFVGATLNYHLADWIGLGVYGGFGAVKQATGLTDRIQTVNEQRRADPNYALTPDGRLTATNLSPEFDKQVTDLNWFLAPQFTFIPFRGKIAFFGSLAVDTDLYILAGPAFVGLSERKACGAENQLQCKDSFKQEDRLAVTGTFGLGLTFYVNKFNAFGLEYRLFPAPVNSGGFDTAGGGRDGRFPDDKINDKDRLLRFNQMLTLSWSFFFPTQYRLSE